MNIDRPSLMRDGRELEIGKKDGDGSPSFLFRLVRSETESMRRDLYRKRQEVIIDAGSETLPSYSDD